MNKKQYSGLYSVHPGVKMMQDWVESLPKKTGKSLQEWVNLLEKEGPKDEKERSAWLKEKHHFGTNAAHWITEYAIEKSPWEGDPQSYLIAADQYVENMFSGSKTNLRPIYDELLKIALSIGSDIKICPCKTIVPIYRNHVIAQIKPTTRTRIDLGLSLKNFPFSDRLIDTGGQAKKDRITHRVPISQISDIDEEVVHWLKLAYERDG